MAARNAVAILPAGGCGLRMGSLPQGPKQLLRVHGRSILCHTIDAMWQVPSVTLIVVVTSEALLERVRADVASLLVTEPRKLSRENAGYEPKGRPIVDVIVRPGDAPDSRHSSIACAVEYLADKGFPLVIVHDAVRPLVPLALVEELLVAAEEYGAAGPWVPLVSTVLKIDAGGLVQETIPRYPDNQGWLHVNSEMPQVFKYPVLAKAYSLCDAYHLLHGTECLELVRKYCGLRAKMIRGDPDVLWKVTFPKDILLAENTLKPP